MSDVTPVGSITITYDLADDGDLITRVNVDGDLPLVVQLGLLDLARDSILHGPDEGDDE